MACGQDRGGGRGHGIAAADKGAADQLWRADKVNKTAALDKVMMGGIGRGGRRGRGGQRGCTGQQDGAWANKTTSADEGAADGRDGQTRQR